MKMSDGILHVVAAGAAAALLAGCGPGGMRTPWWPVTSTQAHHVAAARSWLSPDAAKADLLYISDLGTGDVDVYSYPGGKPEGTLTGFQAPHGECVDAAGDVFVTDTGSSTILEYAHGGTSPIATLSDPKYSPVDCSVDPRNGTLAVTNLELASGAGAGNVALYAHAKGNPVLYTSQTLFFYYSCGYDDKGNLYVSGAANSGNFAFAELPAKSKSFTDISLNQAIQVPGGVQWDGEHVAVEDQGVASEGSVIYAFAISGGTGTKVGTTPLGGSSDVVKFWIQGSKVVGPNLAGNVMFWKYPKGGAATKTIDGLTEPVGATVSLAK